MLVLSMKTTAPSATLYVIDDHPLMREAVVMLLRRIRPGANVVELDRMGAVDAAVQQHGTPDLFTLDLKLPDTSGASGVHELKMTDFPSAAIDRNMDFLRQAIEAADLNRLRRYCYSLSASTARRDQHQAA